MKKLIAILILTTAVFCSWAEDSPELKPLEEIIEYGLVNNPDLDQAEYNVMAARENLTGTFKFEETTLTGQGEYDFAADEDGFLSSLELDVPVTDQISLSGSWDMEDSGSAGIVLNPLNLTSTAEETEGTLKKSEIELTYLMRNIKTDIVLSVLDYQTAAEDYAIKHETSLLAEKLYEAGYALYLEGDNTYEELQDLSDDLTTAREEEIEAQITLADSRSAFILLMGTEADFLPAEISTKALQALVENQGAEISAYSGKAGSSSTMETAIVNLDVSRAKYEATLYFQPDLSVSAAAVFDSGDTPSIEAGISLSISPETFDQGGRELLAEDINLKLRALAAEKFSLKVQLETASAKIAAAEKEVVMAERDLERKTTIYNETVLLREQGERTVLEEEDSQLSWREGKLNLFKALSDLYQVQAYYLSYFM